MALVLAGTVAPMAAGEEDETFAGRVWLGDDGRVAAVTRGAQKGPAGFDAAPVLDVGKKTILPGFVDLHSHLGYNTLPLWVEPSQKEPFKHHNSWTGKPTYQPFTSWSAWTLADQAPESLAAYVQVRALAGGTTAIQGWPSLSRSPTNTLVRCVDDDRVGPVPDPILVSTLTLSIEDLGRRATQITDKVKKRVFVYHCAEGQPGTVVTGEFDDLDTTGCLHPGLAAIHCCALDAGHFARWRKAADPGPDETAGTVVWSPFSNLWLYGVTTDVPAALENRLAVALGSDWGPSGTRNLLGEIKVARIWSDHAGWGFTDHELVRMITAVPGDTIARAWEQPVGRLVPGALGDVVVLDGDGPGNDVWAGVVRAREADVALVTVGGRAVYGTQALMKAAGAGATTSVPIGSATRRVPLRRPDDPTTLWTWADVVARLDGVRRDAAVHPPNGPAAGAAGAFPGNGAAPAASRSAKHGDPPGTPPIVANLDMPGGPGSSAGPPPPGVTVDIAPIQKLAHDRAWLKTIPNRGFHGGILDALAGFYR